METKYTCKVCGGEDGYHYHVGNIYCKDKFVTKAVLDRFRNFGRKLMKGKPDAE